MLSSHQPDNSLDKLTSYCKATADQQRLQILRVLARESFGVLELCHILEVAQPALSHHLKVLHTAGLVETRRQGNSIYYRRSTVPNDHPMTDVRQGLLTTLDDLPLATDLKSRVAEIHANRHAQAHEFFEKNSHRFQENQNLIAEYPNYASCIEELLKDTTISKDSLVVEIGPGESDLLIDLARRADAVIAIDSSQDMLGKAMAKAAEKGVTNVSSELGQLNDFTGPADLIVANMVLHHIASPAIFFHDARERLVAEGYLLIADLCHHDQDWTRDACGDLWAGFDSDELDEWATLAGFTPGQGAYVGLKNGFQVQVKLFQTQPFPTSLTMEKSK